MYVFIALSCLGAWVFESQIRHVEGTVPNLFLACAMLAIAMHVVRQARMA